LVIDRTVIFDRLNIWRDPFPRSGPENMAVDDWLLARESKPLLRVYDWEGEWVSLGYFATMQDAQCMARAGEAQAVRRSTGGGIVDHRIDRTYSLVVPRPHEMARMCGAESYRVIHAALASALQLLGAEARLLGDDVESDSAACFEKPVAWDIVDGAGAKLAGAGQRRTRHGLLHQGSVVVTGPRRGLFSALADRLAGEVKTIRREPSEEDLAALREKFESQSWLERR
jgi:lipoate-protein ligase A